MGAAQTGAAQTGAAQTGAAQTGAAQTGAASSAPTGSFGEMRLPLSRTRPPEADTVLRCGMQPSG